MLKCNTFDCGLRWWQVYRRVVLSRDEMRCELCAVTQARRSYSLRTTTCRVQTSDDRTIAHNSGGNGSHSWSGVSPVLRNRRPGGEIGRNETRRGFRRVVDLWETARSPSRGHSEAWAGIIIRFRLNLHRAVRVMTDARTVMPRFRFG